MAIHLELIANTGAELAAVIGSVSTDRAQTELTESGDLYVSIDLRTTEPDPQGPTRGAVSEELAHLDVMLDIARGRVSLASSGDLPGLFDAIAKLAERKSLLLGLSRLAGDDGQPVSEEDPPDPCGAPSGYHDEGVPFTCERPQGHDGPHEHTTVGVWPLGTLATDCDETPDEPHPQPEVDGEGEEPDDDLTVGCWVIRRNSGLPQDPIATVVELLGDSAMVEWNDSGLRERYFRHHLEVLPEPEPAEAAPRMESVPVSDRFVIARVTNGSWRPTGALDRVVRVDADWGDPVAMGGPVEMIVPTEAVLYTVVAVNGDTLILDDQPGDELVVHRNCTARVVRTTATGESVVSFGEPRTPPVDDPEPDEPEPAAQEPAEPEPVEGQGLGGLPPGRTAPGTVGHAILEFVNAQEVEWAGSSKAIVDGVLASGFESTPGSIRATLGVLVRADLVAKGDEFGTYRRK